MINQIAPNFSLIDLAGNTISLQDFKNKTIVIDFWATWCGPCVASFAGMQKAVEKFKANDNVKFLFINSWERGEGIEKRVAEFIKEKNYPFHVLLDLKNEVVTVYEVEGIPTKFIVDKNGNIRFKSVGFGGDTERMVEELSQMIDLVN